MATRGARRGKIKNRPELLGRTGHVWEYYAVRRWTQQQIADHFDLSQPQVSNIIRLAREEVPEQTREEIVQERIEQLRAFDKKFSEQAMAEVSWDDRNMRDIEAAKLIMQFHQREAKLLGLDAPAKITADGNVTVRYEIAGISPEQLKELT